MGPKPGLRGFLCRDRVTIDAPMGARIIRADISRLGAEAPWPIAFLATSYRRAGNVGKSGEVYASCLGEARGQELRLRAQCRTYPGRFNDFAELR